VSRTRVLLLTALGLAVLVAVEVPRRMNGANLPIHRDLNAPSCFSGWVHQLHWQQAIPSAAVDRRFPSHGGGSEEMGHEGWARHHHWERQFAFRIVPGWEDRLLAPVIAALRRAAAAEPCAAESLRFLRWHEGRDYLRVAYATRTRWGELWIWTVHGPEAAQPISARGRAEGDLDQDHAVNVMLDEEPNSDEEARRIGAKPR